jgi:hypothetical protein
MKACFVALAGKEASLCFGTASKYHDPGYIHLLGHPTASFVTISRIMQLFNYLIRIS